MSLPALAGAGAFLLGVVAVSLGRELGAILALPAAALPLAVARASDRRSRRRDLAEHGGKAPMGRRDALTGLASRAVVLDRLHVLLSGDRSGDRPTALLLVDLIDFDGVNRDLGHAAGDLLLRHTSARMQAGLRQDDLLARLGGDRFAVVLGEVARPADAAAIAHRLHEAFAEPFDLHGALWVVSPRIGVALARAGDGHTPERLLEQASHAVASAKADGRSDIRFADPAVDADVREQRRLRGELADALERGELELLYEPQIDLTSRRMVGAGAVLRWSHPTHGEISTERLVAIADEASSTRPIGRWMLAQACAQAAAWQRMGGNLRVAVGLTSTQLAETDLVAAVATTLAESGLAPHHLELEVGEAALVAPPSNLRTTLMRLHELGVGIALDGFGSGQVALRHLCILPFDTIKLEGRLIEALDRDPVAAAMVRAALGLSSSLGLEIAAKGVASASQLSLLNERGCSLAQGPHFSHAVHAPEIEAIIEGAKLPYDHQMVNEIDDLSA